MWVIVAGVMTGVFFIICAFIIVCAHTSSSGLPPLSHASRQVGKYFVVSVAFLIFGHYAVLEYGWSGRTEETSVAALDATNTYVLYEEFAWCPNHCVNVRRNLFEGFIPAYGGYGTFNLEITDVDTFLKCLVKPEDGVVSDSEFQERYKQYFLRLFEKFKDPNLEDYETAAVKMQERIMPEVTACGITIHSKGK